MFKTVRFVCDVNIGTQYITINKTLSPDDIHLGTRLGMNSHVDTSCVNKHSFIE